MVRTNNSKNGEKNNKMKKYINYNNIGFLPITFATVHQT